MHNTQNTSNSQPGGFLPVMPLKKSNFAKTQKAIKMIREAPLRRHKRIFTNQMNLQDYATLHNLVGAQNANDYLLAMQLDDSSFN